MGSCDSCEQGPGAGVVKVPEAERPANVTEYPGLSRLQVDRFRREFAGLDRDGSGAIDVSEVHQMIAEQTGLGDGAAGLSADKRTAARIKAFMAQFDGQQRFSIAGRLKLETEPGEGNGDNLITFREYLAGKKHLLEFDRQERLRLSSEQSDAKMSQVAAELDQCVQQASEEAELASRVAELNTQIKQAVADGNYSQAAELKTQRTASEEQLNQLVEARLANSRHTDATSATDGSQHAS